MKEEIKKLDVLSTQSKKIGKSKFIGKKEIGKGKSLAQKDLIHDDWVESESVEDDKLSTFLDVKDTWKEFGEEFESSNDNFEENIRDINRIFEISSDENDEPGSSNVVQPSRGSGVFSSIQCVKDILDRHNLLATPHVDVQDGVAVTPAINLRSGVASDINLEENIFIDDVCSEIFEERRVNFSDICATLQSVCDVQEMPPDDDSFNADFNIDTNLEVILMPPPSQENGQQKKVYSSSTSTITKPPSAIVAPLQSPILAKNDDKMANSTKLKRNGQQKKVYSSSTSTITKPPSAIVAPSQSPILAKNDDKMANNAKLKRKKRVMLLGEDVGVDTASSSNVKTKIKLIKSQIQKHKAKKEKEEKKKKEKIVKPKACKCDDIVRPTTPDIQIAHTTLNAHGEAAIKFHVSKNVKVLSIVAHQKNGHTFSCFIPMGTVKARKAGVTPTAVARILRQIRNIEEGFCMGGEE